MEAQLIARHLDTSSVDGRLFVCSESDKNIERSKTDQHGSLVKLVDRINLKQAMM